MMNKLLVLGALVALPLSASAAHPHANPALPGDYPDPSISRLGDTYYASATTSAWAPIFPVLRSKDLVHWDAVTAIFDSAPAWSAGDYWAPEISIDPKTKRTLVYYAAHKKDGPMCVAVAEAASPEGPYKDHGPIVCNQKGVTFGAIDAFMLMDGGKRWLVWKADGNSIKQATPILYQQLSDDGLKLEGEAKEMFRNEPATWEKELVEGPALIRKGEWLYLFFSGADCCGRDCNYSMGVARSKTIAGPWEKDPKNPILGPNAHWKCPGHGTVFQTPSGELEILYHAFDPVAFVDVGRQGMIDEVTIGKDGWPVIAGGKGPSGTPHVEPAIKDALTSRLSPLWQWPYKNAPSTTIEKDGVVLAPGAKPAAGRLAATIGRSVPTGDYVGAVSVERRGASSAGLAAIGSVDEAIGVSLEEGQVVVWRRHKGAETVVAKQPWTKKSATLRLTVHGGHMYQAAISEDGQNWKDVGGVIDGTDVPPWDLGVRLSLVASGGDARFSRYSIVPEAAKK